MTKETQSDNKLFLKESGICITISINILSLSTTPYTATQQWTDVIICCYHQDYYHLWNVTLVRTRHRTNILTSKHRYPHFSKDQFMPLLWKNHITSVPISVNQNKVWRGSLLLKVKGKSEEQHWLCRHLSYRQCSPRSSKSDSTKLLPWN